MPAIAEVKLIQRTCSRWVARPFGEDRWLREIALPPCPTAEPSQCILREPRELAWGTDPGEAIRSLLRDVDPADRPGRVSVRSFDFHGPTAVLDDPEAETELLSFSPSPLWEEIRDSASQRRVGLIYLTQTRRAIVPVIAHLSSGARIVESPGSEESVYPTRLAFEPEDP